MHPGPRHSRLPPAPAPPGGSLVLLPPEEPEADLPPRHWPEPSRRRWWGPLAVLTLGAGALAGWLWLSNQPTAGPPPMPAYAEGLGGLGADEAVREQVALAEQGPLVVLPQGGEDSAITEPAPPGEAPSAGTDEAADDGRPAEAARRTDALPATIPATRDSPLAGAVAAADAPPNTAPAPAPVLAAPQVPDLPVDRGPPPAREATPPAATVTTPAASPEPPRVDRAAAEAAVREGATRFASVVSTTEGPADRLRGMIQASDAAANDLVGFVLERNPTARVADVGAVTIEGELARAEATIAYDWRAQFGVSRQGSSRVRVLARLVDGTWTPVGVQPLTGPPR